MGAHVADNNRIRRSVRQVSVTKGLTPYDSSSIGTVIEAFNEKKRAARAELKTNLKEKKRAADLADMQLGQEGWTCTDFLSTCPGHSALCVFPVIADQVCPKTC